jgi:VIT1/CCC1 family predicted Fe2+/Mn2+ transporter
MTLKTTLSIIMAGPIGVIVLGIVLGLALALFGAYWTYCSGGEVWDWQSSMCVLKCPPTGCV